MSHTPGPWTSGDSEWFMCLPSDMGQRYLPIHGDGYQVAIVWEDEDDATQYANRLLVQAAPDLLAACQTVAHDLQAALDGDDFSGMSDAELFRAFLDVLQPAISKAGGRSE